MEPSNDCQCPICVPDPVREPISRLSRRFDSLEECVQRIEGEQGNQNAILAEHNAELTVFEDELDGLHTSIKGLHGAVGELDRVVGNALSGQLEAIERVGAKQSSEMQATAFLLKQVIGGVLEVHKRVKKLEEKEADEGGRRYQGDGVGGGGDVGGGVRAAGGGVVGLDGEDVVGAGDTVGAGDGGMGCEEKLPAGAKFAAPLKRFASNGIYLVPEDDQPKVEISSDITYDYAPPPHAVLLKDILSALARLDLRVDSLASEIGFAREYARRSGIKQAEQLDRIEEALGADSDRDIAAEIEQGIESSIYTGALKAAASAASYDPVAVAVRAVEAWRGIR